MLGSLRLGRLFRLRGVLCKSVPQWLLWFLEMHPFLLPQIECTNQSLFRPNTPGLRLTLCQSQSCHPQHTQDLLHQSLNVRNLGITPNLLLMALEHPLPRRNQLNPREEKIQINERNVLRTAVDLRSKLERLNFIDHLLLQLIRSRCSINTALWIRNQLKNILMLYLKF